MDLKVGLRELKKFQSEYVNNNIILFLFLENDRNETKKSRKK